MSTSPKMVPNLLTQLTNEFQGDTVSHIASALGETPAKVANALGGLCPTLLSNLASRASTTEGASDIVALIRRNTLDTGLNVASASASSGGITGLISMGRPLIDSILGERANTITDSVAAFAGINRGSSRSLLSLATPVVLGLIGRRLSTTGWNASSLTSLLGDSKSYLRDIPGGLANLLGLAGTYTSPQVVDEPEHRIAAPPAAEYETETKGSSWGRWALPLALLLGLLALLGYYMSRRHEAPTANRVAEQPAAPRVNTPVTPTPVVPVPTKPNLGSFLDRKLPDGTTLHIPANGVESKLLNFIEDPASAVNKNTWFSLDRLTFETDSAKLLPSSQEQLRNLSEILKAYPQVNLNIGGYTDNTGDPAHNLQLSKDRAMSTMDELGNLGIARSRLAADGYGEKFPVADNATEEGRQQNRRIDVRVTKK